MHGDYRHLKRHAELAGSLGIVEKTFLLEDGDVLEMDKDKAAKTGKVTVGRVCIDSGGSASDVVEEIVIKDRKHLSEDGFVMPIIAIDKHSGKIEGAPEIVTRGFAVEDPDTVADVRSGGAAGAGAVECRGARGLRRGEGEDPHGAEAHDSEEHGTTAADHAGDPGDLNGSDKTL